MSINPDIILRRVGEGPSNPVLGTRHDYKLLASESGGAFMQFLMTVPPGMGAPMHEHERDGESFYMLDGEITVRFDDGRFVVAGPGDFVWFPARVRHSFANEARKTATVMVVQSPGVEAERFFDQVAQASMADDFRPERDLMDIAARNGVLLGEPAVA